MIIRLLKWRLGSDAAWYRVCQPFFGIMAGLIAVEGFLVLTKLDLTLSQSLLGVAVVLSLVFQCCIFSELLALKRKAA